MPWVTPEGDSDSHDTKPTENDLWGKRSPLEGCNAGDNQLNLNFNTEDSANEEERSKVCSSGDSRTNFDQWLDALQLKFRSLTDDEQKQTFDSLIQASGGSQLYYLSHKLEVLLKRDFLRLLPTSAVEHLLSFLPACALLTCRQVSRLWIALIDNCGPAWRRIAALNGVSLLGDIALPLSAYELRWGYLVAARCVHRLAEGTAFDHRVLYGHRDRVMAVYYHNGLIATGSDDHAVRLWSSNTGHCIKVYHINGTVATVRFNDSTLVAGCFNTSAEGWNLDTGSRLATYMGHTGAVFSVDFDSCFDVLVTGSVDSTVKVWLLSTGELLRSLVHHRSTWITHVCLYWHRSAGTYSVISRDNQVLHHWCLDSSHQVLSTEKFTDIDDSQLLPGWQVQGSQLTFMTFSAPSIYHVRRVDLQDTTMKSSVIHTFSLPCAVPHNFLSYGSQFTVFLGAPNTTMVSSECSYISFVHNSTGRIMASTQMSPNYRPSKRNSTFMLGDQEWLDGFTTKGPTGVFLITSLNDHGVDQLTWRALGEPPFISCCDLDD